MSSNMKKRQLREEKILLLLNKMGFATREHLQGIPSLEMGVDRNALKILNQMGDLISKRNHMGKNVYSLARKGADLIGVEKVPTWSTQVEHYLLRNDMYVYFGCPSDWKNEKKIKLKPSVGDEKILITDAMFSRNGIYHFLEVDRTQSMVENKKKIQYYSLVNPIIKSQYAHYPTLLFYTTTPNRRETLAKLCKEYQLNFHIYTKEDLA